VKSASTRPAPEQVDHRYLERFLWLSLATAVATVGIKGVAAWLTNSVGLRSDTFEACSGDGVEVALIEPAEC
jgi:divalent metal cation (Fe/Co/Zn/Cd) transporter